MSIKAIKKVQILSNRSIIELKGSDSLSFLQKQTTNNLIKNDYCYTYILSNLGRYLFDFFCYKISNDYLIIDIDSNQAQNLIHRLNFYKLRADTQVAISNKYAILYFRDENLNQFSQNDPKCIKTYPDPRSKLLGCRSLIHDQYLTSLPVLSQDVISEDKYQYAIPDTIDLFYDKSVPLEYGAEQLNGIDFHKGCYTGQEVMSRIKYQGTVRKKIFKVIADQDLSHIPKGTLIKMNDENIIGIFCSNYGKQAIALVNEEKKQDNCSEVTIEGINARLEIPIWRINM